MESKKRLLYTCLLACLSFVSNTTAADLSVDQMRYALQNDTQLSEDQRDELAMQLCKANPLCRILILYPRCMGHDQEVYTIIQQYCSIIYEKKIFLRNFGAFNIIKQFYFDHPWFGDYADKKRRVMNKAEKTFRYGAARGNPLRALLVECPNTNYDHFRLCKLTLRDLFKTRHVCHSDHSHRVGVRMSHAVFSNPSIHFFNTRSQDYLLRIEKALKEFSLWLEEHNLAIENFCIVGKACKATYGKKDTSSIDFVCSEPLDPALLVPKQYRNKSNSKKYKSIKEGLIFDHTKHFYHRGFKFEVK